MTSLLCVDTEMIHVTGMSNGGMFIWTRIMERLAGTMASAGDNALSLLRIINNLYVRNCVQLSASRIQSDA